MEVSVVPRATQGRRVAEWTVGPLEVDRGFWPHFSLQREVEFDIFGDEWLTVFADLSMHYQLSTRYLSWGALSLGPDEEWGVEPFTRWLSSRRRRGKAAGGGRLTS
jgi:hypothetical protein